MGAICVGFYLDIEIWNLFFVICYLRFIRLRCRALETNQFKELYAGRANTVLIFGNGDAAQAVISSVNAQICNNQPENRICIVGSAKVSLKTTKHIVDVILPIVDQIIEALNMNRKSFKLSFTNLEASAIMDIGYNVSGYSADLAIFLAILSANLQIPIPDHIVATGHIASGQGDIRMVKGIPEKVAAVTMDKSIHTFIHPALDQDNSLDCLSPKAKNRIEDTLIKAKRNLKTTAVQNIDDLVQAIFEDRQIVLASLRHGYFDVSFFDNTHSTACNSAAIFISQDNEKRFWSALEYRLLSSQVIAAKELLHAFYLFYIKKKLYPKKFGQNLKNLVLSLPPEIKRLKIKYPLISSKEIIKLSQYARERDHDDVRLLFIAANSGNILKSDNFAKHQVDENISDARENGKLEAILWEISSDNLTHKINTPIDTARAAYIMNSVTIKDFDDFQTTIISYYTHLMRHTIKISTPISQNALGPESFALLERTFARRGGFKAAQSEARTANMGGLRFILDAMTEQYKQEQQIKYISHILKSALDPLDWKGKVDLMRALIKQLELHLPPEITLQPAERFAGHYEDIVKAFVQSIDQVKTLFRSL